MTMNMTRVATLPSTHQKPGKPPEDYKMDVRVVEITPTMASDWLACNTANRNPKLGSIEKYRRDMETGNWDLTGEPIIWDWDGILRNGQNRLKACVLARRPFVSFVIWGIDPSAFRSMDRNSSRTTGDVLQVSGVTNGNAIAGIAALIWRYSSGLSLDHGGRSSPTSAEVLEIVETYPEIKNSVNAIHQMPLLHLRPPALAGFLHWFLSSIDPEATSIFFEKLWTGADLSLGDPILVLRNRLERAVAASRGGVKAHALTMTEKAAFTIKTWNWWRNGDTRTVLRYGTGESFPVPV